MKKHLLISAMFLLSIASYSQTFKSSYVNETKPKFETDTKDRRSQYQIKRLQSQTS